MTLPPLLALAQGKRVRPRKAPLIRSKEIVLHKSVVKDIRKLLMPGWLFWHTPNGEKRDPRTAAKLKAMGVLPGVPDIVLVCPAGKFHGLELKVPGGALSDAQRDFQLWAVRHDIPYSVADNAIQAMTILSHWGAIRNIRT